MKKPKTLMERHLEIAEEKEKTKDSLFKKEMNIIKNIDNMADKYLKALQRLWSRSL